MEKIFEFTQMNIIYNRCILASIAHTIMNGKYELLSSEQSWDDMNYLFQDFEGVRGVISFGRDNFICMIQNDDDYLFGENEILHQLFCNVEKKVCDLAKSEAMQYLLIEKGNDVLPAASIAFWGDNFHVYSNQSEKDLMKKSNNILLPYLYKEPDAIQYWKKYYEMNNDQIEFMKEIYYKKSQTNTFIKLDKSMREKLSYWFGDKITECINSFKELNIFFE